MRRAIALYAFVFTIIVSSPAAAGAQGASPTIKIEARSVEVYATIYDQKNRYLDNLPRDRFEVLENGKPQQIVSFEPSIEGLSCAILLDTTGSMNAALPRVKNSIVKLIDALGTQDSVAIYTFDERLVINQEFTEDKSAAKRAILRTRAQGRTALFDAIAQTSEDISKQPGKKALLVFSDGDDNASILNERSAVMRAKKVGIPLYVIAEGDATRSPQLQALLADLSKSTGGASYQAKQADDIEEVFDKISTDLRHIYMLTYQPPAEPADGKWRQISLEIKGMKDYHIRGKEGYFPN